ncbi:hypothetical protein CXG81DRAFT_1713, partial [Caulochytrium protostelioides]
AKQRAAYAAVDDHVHFGTTRLVGIGSGSTVIFVVERLAQRLKQQQQEQQPSQTLTACVPTSFQATQLILDAALPLGDLNQYPDLDVAFDGADEVVQATASDAHGKRPFHLIKGGGACQLQEKLVASGARRFVIVADDSKQATAVEADAPPRLGSRWRRGVPLEVHEKAYRLVQHALAKQLGGHAAVHAPLRMAVNKAGPVVTDSGHVVLDLMWKPATPDTPPEATEAYWLADPVRLDALLHAIPGILETGLFCGMAEQAYFGTQQGGVEIWNR